MSAHSPGSASRQSCVGEGSTGGEACATRGTPAWCLNLALRLAIAAVFLGASLDKLVHPDRFADLVNDYNLLPPGGVNLFALALPYVEVTVALFLALGIWTPSAALVATGMTVMFMGAISAALLQGYSDLHCGCFTTSQEGKGEAWGLLWRDAALLAACAWLFRRTWCGGGASVSRETVVSRETIQEADNGNTGE